MLCAKEAKDLSESGGEGGEKTEGLGGSPEKERANLHTSSPVHTDRRFVSVQPSGGAEWKPGVGTNTDTAQEPTVKARQLSARNEPISVTR